MTCGVRCKALSAGDLLIVPEGSYVYVYNEGARSPILTTEAPASRPKADSVLLID